MTATVPGPSSGPGVPGPGPPYGGGSGAPRLVRSWLPVVLAGLAAGSVATVAGMLGTKGLVAVVALAGLAAGSVAARRPLAVLLVGPAPASGWSLVPLLDADRLRRLAAGPRGAHAPSRPLVAVASIVAVGGAITVAWLAAALGLKGLLALVSGFGLMAFLVAVRAPSDVALFAVPCSLVLFLHKSFTPFKLVNSGAPAVYITSLGALTVVLYALWAREGTLVGDLAATLRRPLVWGPLAGAGLVLPSLLVAADLALSVAELVRMVWMYLLFVYLAARVRHRGQVLLVVAGLGFFALVELVVTALQWRTGGVLGLTFLGVPTELGERMVDAGAIGRPFGTIVHPVFLGATMGAVSLLFLALGLSVRERRLRAALLAMVPVAVAPMLFAQSRAAILAFVPTALGVLLVAALRGAVTVAVLRKLALAALVAGIALSPWLVRIYGDNFGTDHFSLEVESRVQLNDLASAMIADHPVVGVGLNDFQQVQPRYDPVGLLFAGNPVHNLYLLQIAETGYVGLAGLLIVGSALLLASVRLAGRDDPLLAGLGTAMAAVVVFFAVEELLGFSLRQEIPLALWWTLAGLVAAAPVVDGSLRPGAGPRRHPAAWSRPRSRDARRRGSAGVGVADTPGLRTGAVAGLVMAVIAASACSTPADGAPSRPLRLVLAATDRGAPGGQGICTANGDGTGITRITPDDGRHYDFPQWAMGGTKVVHSMREGPRGSAQNIFLMNPDGTGVEAITDSPWRNDQPKVSPDGRLLAVSSYQGAGTPQSDAPPYEANQTERRLLQVTAVGGGPARFLTDGSEAAIAPAWSPDGRAVAYTTVHDGAWCVARIERTGGRPALLTSAAYSPAPALQWSPDGDLVAFISPTDGMQSDVYVVVAQGGASRPVQIAVLDHELSMDRR